MLFDRWRLHLKRIKREAGYGVVVGDRTYKVKGYFSNQLAVDLQHEMHLEKPLRKAMARRDGPVFDIGVNNGQTLLRILSIDPSREYVGFEPQFACCSQAQRFISDNRIQNAMVMGIALSDTDCMLPMYSASADDEMASLLEDSHTRYDRELQRQYVSARVGDAVISEVGLTPPAILKVDVEGAELNVFRGFKETLSTARPICLFEVLPNYFGHDRRFVSDPVAAANRAAASALFAFFEAAGYRIYQIDADGEEVSIDCFDLDNPAKYSGSDYIAHPN